MLRCRISQESGAAGDFIEAPTDAASMHPDHLSPHAGISLSRNSQLEDKLERNGYSNLEPLSVSCGRRRRGPQIHVLLEAGIHKFRRIALAHGRGYVLSLDLFECEID
jgi:hypothetical protein